MKKLLLLLALCFAPVASAANCPTFAAGDLTYITELNLLSNGCDRGGTATNDSAAAGRVGEFVSSTIVQGTPVGITSAVQTNVTSISLTAGDWDVWFEAQFLPAGGTTCNIMQASVSQTTATIDAGAGNMSQANLGGAVIGATNNTVNVGPSRKSLASTTTIYGVVYTSFGASTMAAWGILRARRVR